MSAQSSTVDLRVRYAETDRMGVVYYANYLVWCEVGRTEYIRTLGVSYASLEARGLMLAVADASVRYHAPARYDDVVRVETTLSEVRSRTVSFDYVVSNAATGSRLASARTVLVAIDAAGRTVAMPADFRALLEAALA